MKKKKKYAAMICIQLHKNFKVIYHFMHAEDGKIKIFEIHVIY